MKKFNIYMWFLLLRIEIHSTLAGCHLPSHRLALYGKHLSYSIVHCPRESDKGSIVPLSALYRIVLYRRINTSGVDQPIR